ncbi:PLP-dependent aminotransferase family protein [Spirillospora sp. CA-294931]|uniref:MocR-like pyridoxine biosynthesis transcription factor PdxR n=1 Tax=Spirillospora sp. CA-294931 TaxID=3240042 RepID=UPI003D9431FE
MDLHIGLEGRDEGPGGRRRDLAARIYRQLLEAILDGRLRPGERLPPTRELAQRLKVARNTVAVAYERLTAEGLLVARVGAGTFVGAAPIRRASGRTAPTGSDVRPRAIWRSVAPPVPSIRPPVYDFRVGTPDASLFPLATWRRLVAAELRVATIRSADYGDPAGHPGLREAIARYTGISRAVRARADDVLVTNGAQQALDLVGRVMIDPGDIVAMEEPGYPPARELFRSLGARVVPVPVDDQGLEVEALPPGSRLVYVTPSHQFPTGTPMPLARRAALLDWAARHDAVIVEDDYDSEFRFSDRPLEPLQSLDRTGRVIYVGTFSKTLLPMLRIGFLVAPASLQPALHAAKQLTDWHGDHVAQAALARFIDSGELPRHIRKATRIYAERHELIVTTLRDAFTDWLAPVPSAAGLHLCARLHPDIAIDITALLERTASHAVAENLSGYCAAENTHHQGLVFGYGAIPTELIEPGLEVFVNAFRDSPAPSARRAEPAPRRAP